MSYSNLLRDVSCVSSVPLNRLHLPTHVLGHFCLYPPPVATQAFPFHAHAPIIAVKTPAVCVL